MKCKMILLTVIGLVVLANPVGAGSTFPAHTIPPLAPNWKVKQYERLSDTFAKRYGIPKATLRGLIRAESSWNRYAVSNKGAIGLTQVMPKTARRFGVSPHLLFYPPTAIKTGARVLAQYRKECGGRLDWGLMAYNAGPSVCRYADNILGR